MEKKITLNPRNSTRSGQRGLEIRSLEIGDLKMCRSCRAWLCIGQNKFLGLRLLSVTLCGSKTTVCRPVAEVDHILMHCRIILQ